MKILRITSSFVPPWSGLGPGPFELSKTQVTCGNQVTVIAKYANGCVELDRRLFFRVHRIRCSNNLAFSALAALKSSVLCSNERFDIIHSHGESALVLLLLRRMLGIHAPVVSSVHIVRKQQLESLRRIDPLDCSAALLEFQARQNLCSDMPSRRDLLFEKIYLKRSDALAVVSDHLKKEVMEGYGIPEAKIKVIRNGVNFKHFNSRHKKDKERTFVDFFPENMRTILFVGVLNGRKGELDLIRAMKKVVAKFPDVRLLIIGNGLNEYNARQMVTELHLNEYVSFVPNVPYEQMPFFFNASRIFVLPSKSEGMPKVLLEAMAAGTPVVASDIPCHKELIQDGVTGYLFKTGRVDLLLQTLIRAIEEPNGSRRIAGKAMDMVRDTYSWEAVAKRLNGAYEVVLRRASKC